MSDIADDDEFYELAPWERALLAGGQLDPKPSDVRDGDLLTGTLYGNPFTDWPADTDDPGDVYFQGGHASLSLTLDESTWRSYVTVTSRKPAPSPWMPWIEHPDAWWQHTDGSAIEHSEAFDGLDTPADWQRVAVIPWDLIEQLSHDYHADGVAFAGIREAWGNSAAIERIIDAADAK